MTSIKLHPSTTALVLIDLQNGVVGMPLAPRSGAEVLAAAANLMRRFRQVSAPVVLVRVSFAADYADALKQPVDKPRPAIAMPAGWDQFPEGFAAHSDIVITKRQWGAFYGTDLDLQLRRRGIRTIVLGGIATNFGVESTARDAWELGYEIVFAEDVMASASAELHAFPVKEIFPRLGIVSASASLSFQGV